MKYLLKHSGGGFYGGVKEKKGYQVLLTPDPRLAVIFNTLYKVSHKCGFLKDVHEESFEVVTAEITSIKVNH